MWLIFFLNIFPLLSPFLCLKNVAVQLSVHNAIKDADLSGPMFPDSCPDVDFERVLGLEFPLCQFTNPSVTSAPPLLKGHGTFVTEKNVMESVATLSLLVASSFFLIWCSMKDFASTESFPGLPDLWRFFVDPVSWIFLYDSGNACKANLPFFRELFKSFCRTKTLIVKGLNTTSCKVVTFGMIATRWNEHSTQ